VHTGNGEEDQLFVASKLRRPCSLQNTTLFGHQAEQHFDSNTPLCCWELGLASALATGRYIHGIGTKKHLKDRVSSLKYPEVVSARSTRDPEFYFSQTVGFWTDDRLNKSDALLVCNKSGPASIYR
jgi:hypothetical protein